MGIQRHLEAVAKDVCVFCHLAFADQAADNGYVECGRSFNVNIIAKRLLQDKGKMGRLGAVRVRIGAVVAETFDCVVEGSLHKPDILAYTGQVGELERGSVLPDDVHQGHIVEQQLVVAHFEFLLRELKSLLY